MYRKHSLSLPGHPRRGAAVYVAVLSVAMVVSILGLGGLMLVGNERSQSKLTSDMLAARVNARAAVDLALARINQESNWRNTFTNNHATTQQNLGRGTISWILSDSDGNLQSPDTNLTLMGIGRVGSATHVSRVTVGNDMAENGPTEFRSCIPLLLPVLEDVSIKTTSPYAQYFRPNLPGDAVAWRVTSLELYTKRVETGKLLTFTVYPMSAAQAPSGPPVDTLSLLSTNVSSTRGWRTFTFTGTNTLSAETGACITMTTNSGTPVEIRTVKNTAEANSVLMKGSPAWNTFYSDRCLYYRVNGIYLTLTGSKCAVRGSWSWSTLP